MAIIVNILHVIWFLNSIVPWQSTHVATLACEWATGVHSETKTIVHLYLILHNIVQVTWHCAKYNNITPMMSRIMQEPGTCHISNYAIKHCVIKIHLFLLTTVINNIWNVNKERWYLYQQFNWYQQWLIRVSLWSYIKFLKNLWLYYRLW